jgi:hypothetical protein
MSAPHMNPMDQQFNNARASIVNRTHRIIRAEALTIREQKQKKRGLWAPLAICSVLLLVVCYAIWFMLDGYDLTPNGVPDASDQMMLLLLWSLPVTSVLLGVVWFKRRGFGSGDGEVSR